MHDEINPACWNTHPDQEGVQQPREDIGYIFNISRSSGASYDTVVVNVHTLGQVPFDAHYWSPTASEPELQYPNGKSVGFHGDILWMKVYAQLAPDTAGVGPLWQPGDLNGIHRAAIIESFEGQTIFVFEVGRRAPFAVMEDHGSSGATEVILRVAT